MTHIVNREELRAILADGQQVALLEALPEKYFREGHLPGALHLPPDRVAETAPALVSGKDARIVVYCASAKCQNSHKAASEFEALGYNNVSVYAGGKADWIEAGFAVEKPAVSSAVA